MKKHCLLFSAVLLFGAAAQAQLGGFIKKASSKDSSRPAVSVPKVFGGGNKSSLSNDDIISGLREALNMGTNNAAQRLSAADGFFKDAAIKILMPAEAKKVESKLRAIGMGKQVDDAILSMNRAAEDAAKEVAPIFISAIRGISIGDGLSILRGGDFAATNYLKDRTVAALTQKFRPIIEASLAKVNATKHWNSLFTNYNRFSAEKVNPDLAAYVTEKSLSGIFHHVGLEEQKIRKDPVSRTSDILKKVFAQ